MENIGILIFTVVLIVAFGFLCVGTFLEFKKMNETNYTGTERISNATLLSAFIDKFFG